MKPRSNSPKMSSSTIAEEYASSLSDLTVNSKPLINMLTMLAEENHDHAPAIVAAVEKHLQKVPSDIKLPVLYLIDSIVKNVGHDYINLFTQNIVTTFCTCFEKVDERTRAQMFKLRQTWNDVFPAKKLYNVDLCVSRIDPAWPITAPPPTSIHVNPKFFAKPPAKADEAKASPPVVVIPDPNFSLAVPEPKTVSEIQMRDQLLRKQKELIELQQKKLTLESKKLTAQLEEQQKQLHQQTGGGNQFFQVRPSMPQNAEAAQWLEFITAASPMSQAKVKSTTSFIQQLATKTASVSSKPLPAAKPVSKTTQPKELPQSRQLSIPLQLPSEKVAAPPIKQVSRVRDPRLAARGLPSTVIQESSRLSPVFESVSLVESATPKAHITINLGCDNKNNVPNKERRGITKPHIMSTKARSTGKLSPPTIDISKGQEVSRSKVLQPSSSLSPSKYKIPRSKESTKPNVTELSAPAQKKDENKKGKDDVLLKKSSPSKSVSPKKKTLLEKDKISPKSKSLDKEITNIYSKSVSPRKKAVDKKVMEPVDNPRTVGKDRDRLNERDKYESDSDGWSPSPPPPPVISDAKKQEERNKFRDVKISSKGRNYVRRNRRAESRSRSPILSDVDLRLSGPLEKRQKLMSPEESVKKPLVEAAINVDATKDVDLRQLPGKRPSSEGETCDQLPTKKSKAEMFDVLFGNEDVDLRRLATSQPSPPPPPIISQLSPNSSNSDISSTKSEGKKLSSKTKSSDDRLSGNGDVHPRDWSKFKGPKSPVVASPYRTRRGSKPLPGQRDRLGRPFLFQRSPGGHNDGRRFSPMPEDTDMRRHSRMDPTEGGDDNMHVMIAQGQNQLQSGDLTQKEYNTLITSVVKMNEDKKLQEAKRRDENWVPRRQRLDLSPVSDDGSLADQVAHFSPCSDTSDTNRRSPPQAKSMDLDDRFRGFRHAAHNSRGPRFNNWARGQQQQWMLRPSAMRPMQQPPFVRHPGNDASFGWRPPHPSFMNQMPGPPPFSGDQTRFLGPRLEHFDSHTRSEQFDTHSHKDQFDTEMEQLSHPELPLADTTVLEHIANDSMRTINIDGQPREIRYYGETALTMVAWDDPREVVFQRGTRRILFDERDSFVCAFNDTYRDCVIDGKQHKVRFGAPTRELYIDSKWYECYFGGPPITIEIDGKMRTVKLEGPPPQVKLGYTKRLDLCAGKINLIINGANIVPIFLDAKPQRFDIENKPHILRFVNALTTVLINGQPFDVEFGGLPKPIMVRNKKHFIRFSGLPRGLRPGYISIRNMEGGRMASPPHEDHQEEEESKEDAQENEALVADHTPVYPMMSSRATRRALHAANESNSAKNSPSHLDDELVMPMTGVYVNNKISTGPISVPLDMLTSLLPTTLAPSSGFGYQVEPDSHSQDGTSFSKSQESMTSNNTITVPSFNPFLPLKLNVGELFQKLVATGIVPLQNENESGSLVEIKKDEEVSAVVKPVDFTITETLRLKQPGMVWVLYSGIQCSSCGVRFPPEETVKYSQHLDWHFRQNRRDRDNTRKAQSRKWYYDVSDWIQFEEIEDLEHRAQSWFESQQEATNVGEDNEPIIIPSVPVGENSENPICEMCHDKFEQFYNEESEEWHFKLAIRVEDKIYHPLCYDDFKASMLLESSTDVKDESKEDCSLGQDLDGVVTVKAEPDEPMNVDAPIESDKPIKKEICDTNEAVRELSDVDVVKKELIDADIIETDNMDHMEVSELPTEDLTNQEDTGVEMCSEGESVVARILDDIFESAELQLFGPRVVKLEPEDDVVETESKLPAEPAADTTHAAVVSSIDGNVQFEDKPQASAAAGVSKIKINITKPIQTRESLPESNTETSLVENVTDRGLSPLSRQANSDEDSEPPPPGVETLPEPAKLKPKLVGRQLTILPPVNKGTDLSGLCSIM